MPPPIPLITLLTDFGTKDHFVASMKGVILSRSPAARIIDLSHQITPFQVDEAAYFLQSCYRYFPVGTVHVAVVDPGVGTSRRPLAVRTSRCFFLGPDNGLFSYVLDGAAEVEVREIEHPQVRLNGRGPTFDGRDLFAPAAAWLATQQPFESLGRRVETWAVFDSLEPTIGEGGLVGKVVCVDHFGNLISNVTDAHVDRAGRAGRRIDSTVLIAGHRISGLVSSYADGSPLEPAALINSNGLIEIFLKEGSAAQWLRAGIGAEVVLS